VGLLGPGLIGSALLEQIRSQAKALHEQLHIDVRVRGIMSSTKMVLADPSLELSSWREALADGEPADLEAFATHLSAPHLPHAVIIDCTAKDFGDLYVTWLDAGIHVVTPNKKANAGPGERYRRLRKGGRPRRAHYFYEATVGAGLPVIKTLRDLVQTGDRILAIEGVLSGTLSYLFNTLTTEVPFSRLVREAKEKGFTEPDPRDDLSGTDVARKVVILAREMGLDLELDEIPVQSLVPAALAGAPTAEAFVEGLTAFDDDMSARLEQAARAGEVLRYVGIVEQEGGARVQLRAYPKEHAFAHLSGSDNIIAFTTERYFEQPLIVQGPGAGPEVTAAGVFADLLRLAAHLGSPS
jgi:aspartokinase/homoserine dehydrogenase 1